MPKEVVIVDNFSVNVIRMRIIIEFKRHILWISNAKFDRGFNPLTPNDPYKGRTAPLTSKVASYKFNQQI